MAVARVATPPIILGWVTRTHKGVTTISPGPHCGGDGDAQGEGAEHDRQNMPTGDMSTIVLIAGGEDAEAGAVSFRFRDGRQQNKVPIDEAVAIITDAIRDRVQV